MASRLTLLLLALLLAGCGSGGGGEDRDGRPTEAPPVLGQPAEEEDAVESLGFPAFATKNTTRVGGADPLVDAAGVARAVYPSAARKDRPKAVTLVDAGDWRAAISAAQLAARPTRFPILLGKDGELPPASEDALTELDPTGSEEAGKAEVVRVGARAPRATGRKSTDVGAADAAETARAIDRLAAGAAGTPSRQVIVASSDAPAHAMPAASLSARSGAPVLWTGRDKLPNATRAAIRFRDSPRIYIVGPQTAVSKAVEGELKKLGPTRRLEGEDAVRTAVAVARYAEGAFGWNVTDPGHGLVFASTERPADAAAAALLATSGTHGPLLLVEDANALPSALEAYLLDIQPGYAKDPVRGVYNHGWILGDESALSIALQARLDSLLEIQPVETGTTS